MRRIPRAITALGVALAVAATALAQSPAPKVDLPKATSSKSPPLSAYIPKDKLIYYAELQGTAAHAEAWSKTAASKIVNDTPTGAMLEELLTQLLNVPFSKAPVANRKPTPAEVAAVFKYAAAAGTVFAVSAKPGARQGVAKTMVYAGAMRDDASKKTFAAFVQGLTPAGGKTAAVAKPGNRTIIVVTRADGTVHLNFWVENKLDLVVTDDPDAVIATLDKTAPSATDHPTRLALLKEAAGEEPLALGWLENSAVPGESPLRDVFGPKGDTSSIKRVTYRLGLRGSDLVHDLRLVAPSPRPPIMALLDGAKFDVKTMPPLPDGVVEFSALAIDPAKLYGQVAALAKTTSPGSEAVFAKLEASVKAKTKMRLREDILGRLGPKVLAYTSPSKSAAKPGGLLAGLSGGGFQVPKGAILIEMKDAKAVGTMLDSLVIVANKEIRAAMTPPAAADAEKAGSPRPGGQPKSKAQATPEFRPGTTNPKTYNLNLPPALGSMTNLRLSIVVGKKYLVIATMPDAAKEALAAEAKNSDRALSGDVAKVVEDLAPGMVLLEVSDPRDSLPEGLVNLPASLTAAFAVPTPPPAVAPPSTPGGRPGGRGPGGRPGLSTAAEPGAALPTAGLGDGGNPVAPGGAATPPPVGGATFQVDAAKIPSADAIRPLIGPSATAVYADDQGIRLVVRHSFPDLGMLASLPTTIRAMSGSAQALGAGKPPGMAMPGSAPRGAVPPAGSPGGKPPAVMPID